MTFGYFRISALLEYRKGLSKAIYDSWKIESKEKDLTENIKFVSTVLLMKVKSIMP